MDRLTLADIVEEIKKTQPLVDENLESGHHSTLNARRGRQARAIETMKELTERYAQLLQNSAVFVFVVGAAKNEFTKIALKNSNAFGADPEDFYKNLLKEIHPSMFKSGPSNIFDILGRVLENKMLTLNVREYPQPQFKNSYQRTIKGEEDVLQLIKDVINDQVGGEIAGVNAVRSLVPQAIKRGHGKTVTPIILNAQDEKLSLRLVKSLQEITPYSYLVVAGDASEESKITGAITVSEVNKTTVKEALQLIEGMVKRV